MTTTAPELSGYRVTKNLGLVRGISVRSRSLTSTMGASFQSMLGGGIGAFVELCEQTRSEAFALMVAHAEALGANAILAIRYDATEIMDGISEVLCYGTAVVVEIESR